ncbi:hypothetical protein [Actinomadura sp. 7K534]|uniref:hypothetical protein n=1 Tax=Actinomadura sp. 7K534 TaxID=2530366 RepID=UPI0032664108
MPALELRLNPSKAATTPSWTNLLAQPMVDSGVPSTEQASTTIGLPCTPFSSLAT